MTDKHADDKIESSVLVPSGMTSDIKKAGVLRKLKTMKKKYFVLRNESESGPARLEYYDSEKKFRSGIAPKRSIPIKTCFNINRKVDAKQKHAIALYTKDDCFSVVAENESILEEWLTAMLEVQLFGNCVNGEQELKPKFEHVWQVNIGEKSLAYTKNLKGSYRLCLTASSLTLIKMDQSDEPQTLEFPLMSIRRCGHTNNYFLIELGRSSITGAGELWLETEHVVIAQNMHEATLNAMKSCREHEDMGPLSRPRSASNSENSRPIVSRRPVQVVNAQSIPYGSSIRERCDSMPSRPRTISEGQDFNNRNFHISSNHPLDSLRFHSPYSRAISYSPPGLPNALSPGSAACSTDSAGSSLSIDDYDSSQSDFMHRHSHNLPTEGALHTEPPIKEEPADDYLSMSIGSNFTESTGYLFMAPVYSASAPTRPSSFLNQTPSEKLCSSVLTPFETSDYIDMTSPTHPPEDYIPMSPLREISEGKRMNVIGGNTRNAELPSPSDDYVHAAPRCDLPLQNNTYSEGYLDMSPLSSSLPKAYATIRNPNMEAIPLKNTVDKYNEMLSHSPDPSVSLSQEIPIKEEYPLDKVKSLLAETEDASEDYIRPVRAYSMGSRPQPKKSHLSLQADGSRIRAYSLGSQASSSRNKIISNVDRDCGILKRIDIKTGPISSSATLLNKHPRMRSSASRGDMGEDLMEIDYDKPRYFSSGTDIRDQNFTIEPVGRSRSGSCSSASALSECSDKKSKMYNEKNGVTSFVGQLQNCNVSACSNISNDYLSMSLPSEVSKPVSKPFSSGQAAVPISVCQSMESEIPSALKCDQLSALPGDYVSLDPSIDYSSLGGDSQGNPIKSSSKSNKLNPLNPPGINPFGVNTQCVQSANVVASKALVSKVTKDIPILPSEQISPDKSVHIQREKRYFLPEADDMSSCKLNTDAVREHGSESSSPKKQEQLLKNPSLKKISVKSKNSVSEVYSFIDSVSSAENKTSKNVEECEVFSSQIVFQAKGRSVPSSPTSTPPVLSHTMPCLVNDCVPKTPPPSPQFASKTNIHVVSSGPLIASLSKHLAKTSDASTSHSAPNSRPSSIYGNTHLNYAALDLPSSLQEECSVILPEWKKQPIDVETKEIPLSYAQIDFLACIKKPLEDACGESLSHL